MKKLLLLAVACAALVGVAEPFKDGDRVVFFGDSITHHGAYPKWIALYYYTRFPDRDIWFSNSGESGGSAGGAFRRLDFDVVAKKPTAVAVMFGMNDVGRGNWPRTGSTVTNEQRQAASIAGFKRQMTDLVAKIRATCGNPQILYLTPSPYDQTCLIDGKPSDIVPNDGLAVLGTWVRQQAARENAVCADLQRYLADLNAREQAKDPGWSFMRLGGGSFDRVHPGAFGHQLFAYRFLKAQGAPAYVSKVSIEAARALTGETRNAVITDLKATRRELSFTCLEKALPYPYSADTEPVCDYSSFNDELNREIFRVSLLDPGLYALTIDGIEVGRWTTQELSAGVDLSRNPRTPMYAQAQKVLAANEVEWKNQINVRDVVMYRHWNRKKNPAVDDPVQYAKWFEAKYPGGKAPGFSGYMARQLYVYGSKLPELEKTIAAARAETRRLAQPVPHAWKLVRVGEEKRAWCRSTPVLPNRANSLLPAGRNWRLVWHDEFDGTSLDETKWGYRTTFWGTNAYWFAKPDDNAVEVSGGTLKLKLVKKPDGQFVSPQLQTGELMWDRPWDDKRSGFWPYKKREPAKFLHRYGYYECRCKLQKMPGWWSAFWMQTETQGASLDVGRCGIEQDIMESFDPGSVIPHAFHGNGYGGDYRGFHATRSYKAKVKNWSDSPYSTKVDVNRFHVFGFLWEPDGYTCFIDGRQSGYKVGGAKHGENGYGEDVSHVPEFILLTTEAKWYRNNKMTGKGVPELEAAAKAGDVFEVDHVRVFDWE